MQHMHDGGERNRTDRDCAPGYLGSLGAIFE